MDIIGVHYEEGSIANVKLTNGKIVEIGTAIEMCKRGELPGYHVGSTRNDSDNVHETLVTDRGPHINLSDMPQF